MNSLPPIAAYELDIRVARDHAPHIARHYGERGAFDRNAEVGNGVWIQLPQRTPAMDKTVSAGAAMPPCYPSLFAFGAGYASSPLGLME